MKTPWVLVRIFEVYDRHRCIRYLLKLLLWRESIYAQNMSHTNPIFCPIGSRLFSTMTTRITKVSNFVGELESGQGGMPGARTG